MIPQDEPFAGLDEDAVFARAAEIQKEIEKRLQFDVAVKAGRSNLAETMTEPQVQDGLARTAVTRAFAEAAKALQSPPPQSKGPARRVKPKVGARKQQRQARRRQR